MRGVSTPKAIALTVSALLVVISCALDNKFLPQGWRMPGASEIGNDWRDNAPDGFLIARGDFNGDGIEDEARLLLSKKGNKMGLFAFLSQEAKSFRIILLDEKDDAEYIEVFGVTTVSPGLYKTACGKGYWECNEAETPEIFIKYDAIDYFKIESANCYFYWDSQTKSFKIIWISD